MPTTRTHATLRIWPKHPGAGSAATVTQVLDMQPTKSHEAGDARSPRDTRAWGNAMWSLESDLPWESPLAVHIDRICDALEQKRDALVGLTQDGYLMDVFCFVEVENGQGGVLLDPNTLRRLADLAVELDLDIYASGEEARLVALERVR